MSILRSTRVGISNQPSKKLLSSIHSFYEKNCNKPVYICSFRYLEPTGVITENGLRQMCLESIYVQIKEHYSVGEYAKIRTEEEVVEYIINELSKRALEIGCCMQDFE